MTATTAKATATVCRWQVLAVVLATMVIAWMAAAPAARAAVNVGDKPELQFQALDGTAIDRKALDGKIVVVDFWATWCGPCMAEADHMVRLYQEHKDKGLVMIGISLDQQRGRLEQVIRDKGFVWPQQFDGQGWGNAFAKAWGVTGIPATFILSPDGVVLWKGHPAQIDGPLAQAFKNHPPRLIDRETLAKSQAMMDKVEAALKAGKSADAAAALSKLPAPARSDKDLGARIDAALKQLDEYADGALKEADAALEAKDFKTAVTRLRELSKVSGLAASAKASERLKEVLANPDAKAALEAAEKAEREKERAAKADELLAAARKLQEAKKHEQAYAQFKTIAAQYAGTDAAAEAAGQVKTYEADKAFMKKAGEAAVAGKARGLLSMANSYKASGRADLAKQKYQQVVEQFPGTTFAEEAKRELDKLK